MSIGGQLIAILLYSIKRSLINLEGGIRVRVGADKEFIDRVRHNIGRKSVVEVLPSIPVTFSIEDPRSLTRSNITHSVTAKHGVRREYNESAAYWRASSGSRNLHLDPRARRLFPAPAPLLPKRPSSRCDFLFVTDFNWESPALMLMMDYLNSMVAKGLTLSLFQWCTYHSDVKRPLRARAISDQVASYPAAAK